MKCTFHRIVGVVLLAAVLLVAACQPAPDLVGTKLDGEAAPSFRLTDQFGKPVALDDLRGKPVAVTFLYTHCPDVCPLTAERIRTTLDQLGDDASKVAVVVVSTDPVGDTVAAAHKFSADHGLLNRWHYLIGSQADLQTIWSAYAIHAAPSTSPGIVEHAAYVYMLDKQGRQRALLNPEFTPVDLARNFRILLAE